MVSRPVTFNAEDTGTGGKRGLTNDRNAAGISHEQGDKSGDDMGKTYFRHSGGPLKVHFSGT